MNAQAEKISIQVGTRFLETNDPDTAHDFIDKHAPRSTSGGGVATTRKPVSDGKSGQLRLLNRENRALDAEDLRVAHAFFGALSESGGRAKSEDVAAALKVKGKGIGARMPQVRRVVEVLGFNPDAVFDKVRVPGKGNFWKSRAKFSAAFDAVKKAVSGS